MIRYKGLHLFGSTALAVAAFFFSSLCLASGAVAQSAAPAATGSSLSPATSTFLVAPSFPLGYAPSSLAAGDLRRSGKLDLVTADYKSGKITVFLGVGQGSFARGAAYDAGPHPSAVVVADIDGSGKPSVLVSNESAGTISVLFGNGDGTLQPRQSYAVGFNPSFIATGNFEGNGYVDVAVAGKSGLAIFLNSGNGNLKRPFLYPLGKTPTALTAADFNGDGLADLALANADGTISILLGNGAGQFRSIADIRVASGSLSSIVTGDFNQDGKIDLVVTQPGLKLVSVLMGKGDGTFAPAESSPVGNEPVSTLVADVDGDGVADLIVINKSSNTFSVLGGIGDGTFKRSIGFVTGNAPLAAVASDFYGNGHTDLAIINHSSQTVSVAQGNGDGTFQAGRSYSTGQKPVSIASGTLTGDKIPGLVVANYCGSDLSCSQVGGVAVFLADDQGVYRLSSAYTLGAGPVSVALADVNGDGNLDVTALNRLDKTVSVLLGVGDGTFGQPITFALAGAPIAVAVGDLNKDGKPDLAVLEDCGAATCSQPGSLEILQGAGSGSFQSTSISPVAYAPTALAIGDINGDKNLDIIVANRCGKDASCQSSGAATVLVGDGTGKFTSATDIILGKSPSSIALGNLSGTGLDLIVSRSTDNQVAVLHGNGDGSFQAPVPYPVGAAPASVVVADFNGDGLVDVAVANLNDSTVSVLFGRGDGTLQSVTALPVGGGPTSLTAIGGTTGGHASLATANSGSSTLGTEVTVLQNIHPMGVTANTTTLTATPATMTVNPGAPTTLSVTVAGGSGTPTGTVNITGNGTPASVCSGLILDATGSASCTTSALQTNTTTLTATYSGDGTYSISTGTASVTVNALTPTITITPSPASPSVINTSVTFTASLTGSLTPVTPSGTMTFAVGGTTVAACTGTVTAAGVKTCTINNLALGVNSVTATYSGDTNFVVAAPGSASYTIVSQAPTVVLVAAPAGASVVNQPVTFTATLTPQAGASFSPIAPTGTVAFSTRGAMIAGCGAQPLTAAGANYTAQCSTTGLALGGVSIFATFNPTSANYGSNASADLPYTVNAQSPTVVLEDAPAGASVVNQPVTFTATLAPQAGSSFTPTAPTGTVNFTAGGTTITGCAAQPLTAAGANYTAQCSTAGLALGTNVSIVAIFNPTSANYNSCTSATLQHTVNAQSPTVVVVAAPAGASVVNQPVTFTATLAPQAGATFSPIAPTGTVNFTAGGTTITGCAAQPLVAAGANYTGSCTTAGLGGGNNVSITATYNPGNTNYNTATSATLPYTVTPLTPTMTVTDNPPGTGALNASVTFTATLTPPAGQTFSPNAPAGTVGFTASGTAITGCTAQPVSGTAPYIATCTTSALAAGTNIPIVAIFAPTPGNNNYLPSTSASLPHTITALHPTISMTPSPASPSALNTNVTFTASLTGATLTPVLPTGTMTFALNGATFASCTGAVNSSGVRTCSIQMMPAGSNTVTATYSGDTNYVVGAAGSAPYTTTALPGTLTISASPGNSVAVGSSVTFTATLSASSVAPITPSGTVTFKINGASSPDCPATTIDATQKATCTTQSLVVPADIITASYAGDTNFTPVPSANFTETVTKASPTVGSTSSPNPASVNQSVTFTATVPSPAGGTPTVFPSGSVTFTQGANVLCGGPVVLSSVYPPTATCTYSFPRSFVAPAASLTATYSGDSNFTSGTPGTFSEVVNSTSTTTSLTSTPNASTVNQQVAFTATVTPSFTGTTKPAGTVVFVDALKTLCTLTIASDGTVPVCNYTFDSVGSHNVVASFTTSDSNFSSSVSAADVQTVSAFTPTVSVAPSSSSITTSQALTITVAVGGGSGNPTPTGTVTLTSGSYTSTATTLTSGHATINVPAGSLATGTDTLTAAYSGDNNYSTATGDTSVTVTVPSFAVTGNAVSVSSGATTGNTSTITVTPGGGFTGSVTMTATITSRPAGAQNLPTLSFGSTSPISITDASAKTATLTIFTTAATSAALTPPAGPGLRWYAGSTTVAFGLIFGVGIPVRGRRWRTRFASLLSLGILACGLLACGSGNSGGGGNPGTTPGTYTVTVTGTSGSTTATGTVTLTVR